MLVVRRPYKWEEAFALKLLTPPDVESLTELRMARNRLVHSDAIDAEDIAYWAEKSQRVLNKLANKLKNK